MTNVHMEIHQRTIFVHRDLKSILLVLRVFLTTDGININMIISRFVLQYHLEVVDVDLVVTLRYAVMGTSLP